MRGNFKKDNPLSSLNARGNSNRTKNIEQDNANLKREIKALSAEVSELKTILAKKGII